MITTQWLMTFFVGFMDCQHYLLPFLDLLILDERDFWHKVYGGIFSMFLANQEKLLKMQDISEVAHFFQELQPNYGFESQRQFI
jgi:hypothetical protein